MYSLMAPTRMVVILFCKYW